MEVTLSAEPNAMALLVAGHGVVGFGPGTNYSPVPSLTVMGSNHRRYPASGGARGSCRGFGPGQYTIAFGQQVTGCLGFDVPSGVHVASLRTS